MSKNLIFCFSGTGNSLDVAKQIAKQLDADLVPMTGKVVEIEEGTDTIGFVYPIYFGGLPRQVRNYISQLNIPSSSYTYAIGTYGGMCINGISALHVLLKGKNPSGLNYGKPLLMASNYIAMYPMETDPNVVSMKNEKAQEALQPMIADIVNKETNEIKNSNWLISKYTVYILNKNRSKDRFFTVSDSCTSCKRCEEICPAKNITMEKSKPSFHGNCEQCMACIQTCPVKAINFKNKTNEGKRYFHPSVTVQELISFNHKSDVENS